jgi:hypothetical protein
MRLHAAALVLVMAAATARAATDAADTAALLAAKPS